MKGSLRPRHLRLLPISSDHTCTIKFCGACLNFSREKDSAIPRRP